MFWIHACCRTLYSVRRTRSMYHVKDYYINIDSTLTKFYVLKIQIIVVQVQKQVSNRLYEKVLSYFLETCNKAIHYSHKQVKHTETRHFRWSCIRHHAYVMSKEAGHGGQHINDQIYLKCYDLFSYKLSCNKKKFNIVIRTFCYISLYRTGDKVSLK